MAEGRNSVIISIFSTSSGNGKTVTAINLAAGLANEGYAVCLVDLDLQFGDIATYLKINPKVTITDAQIALENEEENFDVLNYLTAYNYKDSDGKGIEFFVLPRPPFIFDAYGIEIPVVEHIVNSLKWFDFVVIDLNAAFSALNLAVLDLSTIINFLGVVDFLPSVKNFKIGYDTLIRFEYEESKIRLVENRSNSQKLITGQDVERLIGTKFYHQLPNDFPSINKSIREGVPLIFSSPDAAITKSFIDLAAKYTNRHVEEETPAEEEKKGFFSKIFGKFFGKR